MTKSPYCVNVSPSERTGEMFKRLNEETQIEGEKWFHEARRVNFFQIFLKAKFAFLKTYFLKGSIVKGYPGFMQALHGFLFQLLSYAKYWELTERKRGKM